MCLGNSSSFVAEKSADEDRLGVMVRIAGFLKLMLRHLDRGFSFGSQNRESVIGTSRINHCANGMGLVGRRSGKIHPVPIKLLTVPAVLVVGILVSREVQASTVNYGFVGGLPEAIVWGPIGCETLAAAGSCAGVCDELTLHFPTHSPQCSRDSRDGRETRLISSAQRREER